MNVSCYLFFLGLPLPRILTGEGAVVELFFWPAERTPCPFATAPLPRPRLGRSWGSTFGGERAGTGLVLARRVAGAAGSGAAGPAAFEVAWIMRLLFGASAVCEGGASAVRFIAAIHVAFEVNPTTQLVLLSVRSKRVSSVKFALLAETEKSSRLRTTIPQRPPSLKPTAQSPLQQRSSETA
jgi:hypothetical protein